MDDVIVKDCNGNILLDGDAVLLVKSLKVRSSSVTIRQGTLVKTISLTANPEAVDCRVDEISIVLITEFLKNKS